LREGRVAAAKSRRRRVEDQRPHAFWIGQEELLREHAADRMAKQIDAPVL